MELRSNNGPDEQRRIDATRARTQVEKHLASARAEREGLADAPTDNLDLSAAAQLFTAGVDDPERTALVDSLKAAYESGTLNTRERIERAAHNLLGGE